MADRLLCRARDLMNAPGRVRALALLGLG